MAGHGRTAGCCHLVHGTQTHQTQSRNLRLEKDQNSVLISGNIEKNQVSEFTPGARAPAAASPIYVRQPSCGRNLTGHDRGRIFMTGHLCKTV